MCGQIDRDDALHDYYSWRNVAFMRSASPMDEGRRHEERYYTFKDSWVCVQWKNGKNLGFIRLIAVKFG